MGLLASLNTGIIATTHIKKYIKVQIPTYT